MEDDLYLQKQCANGIPKTRSKRKIMISLKESLSPLPYPYSSSSTPSANPMDSRVVCDGAKDEEDKIQVQDAKLYARCKDADIEALFEEAENDFRSLLHKATSPLASDTGVVNEVGGEANGKKIQHSITIASLPAAPFSFKNDSSDFGWLCAVPFCGPEIRFLAADQRHPSPRPTWL
jgi:hypothetical protein